MTCPEIGEKLRWPPNVSCLRLGFGCWFLGPGLGFDRKLQMKGVVLWPITDLFTFFCVSYSRGLVDGKELNVLPARVTFVSNQFAYFCLATRVPRLHPREFKQMSPSQV